MKKSKGKNLTLAEAGDFFDTHDLFESAGATEVVDLKVSIPKRKYIGVELKLFRKIQDAARKAHRSEDSLIQEWLREKVG